jgi:UDP-N-acetyl-2-amino-2-deoxyglucuronate dehydrogenase
MKFLLIGNEFIAPRHKEAIKNINGEIVDIIDIEDDWKKAVENTNADCVVILTPNDLHFEMAKLSAECRKTVLCEKPLAIKSKQAEILSKYPNIFTVLQLRYHPDVERIRSDIKERGKNEIEMDISVYREDDYYQCWKGQKERSGGVLFNLGIHYFDLLLYIFGDSKKVMLETLDDKTGTGTIEGDNYTCKFKISTDGERNNQRRIFNVNGNFYNFSSRDNLSYENLHRFVYSDLLNKKGVLPKEALKSIKLIEELYGS